MNIVPKLELSIDELFTKAYNTSMSMVQPNISIESIFKQLKSYFCIK